jgi:hypothetical protein
MIIEMAVKAMFKISNYVEEIYNCEGALIL